MTKFNILISATCLTAVMSGSVFATEPGPAHGNDCLSQDTAKIATGKTQRLNESAVENPSMAKWEKERALYLHDIQMSSLDQKETNETLSRADYTIISSLIDAELYTTYAQSDQVFLGDPKTAKNDLDQAITNLKTAQALSSGDEKSRITKLMEKVSLLQDDVIKCNGSSQWEDMHDYESVRSQMSQFIQRIG